MGTHEDFGGTASAPATKIDRGELARRRILDAAAVEFADKGYHGGSMRIIARGAGFELGHMQYYFKNKKALWDSTVAHVVGGLQNEWGAVEHRFADRPPEATIAAMVRVFVKFAADHPNFVSLITRTRPASSPLSAPFRKALGGHALTCIRLIERSQANGIFVQGNPSILFAQLTGASIRIFSALDMGIYLGRTPLDPEVVEAQIKTCISVFMPGYGDIAPDIRWD